MEIGNILRKNMFNKHQEIENDFENTKYKAMEVKRNDIDYIEWYNNVYNSNMLKSTLKVLSTNDFERKYTIVVDGKKASHWYYTTLSNKNEYEGHELAKEKKLEFITQLYDILVNGNGKEYYGKNANTIMNTQTSNKTNYIKWYKTFDIKQFMSDNGLNNTKLCEELGFSQAVISRLINKRKYTKNSLIKLYNYVMKITNNIDYFNWFKDFDLKDYMKQNNLNNATLGAKLGLGIVSISNLANKKFYTKKTLEKLYDYIHAQKTQIVSDESMSENADEKEINDYDDIEILDDEQDDNNTTTIYDRNQENDIEIEVLDTNETPLDESTSDKVDNSINQIEIDHDNNAILRKILINRLTDEEKLLIELFGGKLC